MYVSLLLKLVGEQWFI